MIDVIVLVEILDGRATDVVSYECNDLVTQVVDSDSLAWTVRLICHIAMALLSVGSEATTRL